MDNLYFRRFGNACGRKRTFFKPQGTDLTAQTPSRPQGKLHRPQDALSSYTATSPNEIFCTFPLHF